MDLDSFAAREFRAGQMAVVFYRKHPAQEEQLHITWMAQLNDPVETLLTQPDFLQQLHAFDDQTNTLLRALASSLEALMAIDSRPGAAGAAALPADRLRPALHNVLRVIFDVERTRGKVQEWFSNVEDPAKVRAAQALAAVLRKIEFLNLNAGRLGLPATLAPLDVGFAGRLRERIGDVAGASPDGKSPLAPGGVVSGALRRLATNPTLLARLIAADRFIQLRLQASGRRSWSQLYSRVRGGVRRMIG